MQKAIITTIEEEFKKSKVKAHVRTKRGKLERVKEFSRTGEKKAKQKLWTDTENWRRWRSGRR
jgi:hypothetical protein